MINYVIAHTHWDREWYFTDKKSIVYSLYDFDEIIDFLEKNEEFKSFLLDGQTSIINDYIAYRPENINRIKKLIKEERLIIGPWFSQTDTLVICGESIIRNLLYGICDSLKYGNYQKIGYLPDSFGMSCDMPTIYSNFNLKYAVFRRGISDNLIKEREFVWKSKSGKEIKTFNIFHYGLMAYPPNDVNDNYYDELINKLKKFNNQSPYIIFNGEDQKPIRKNLTSIIKNSKYNLQIYSLENALDNLFENIESLEEYEGEFTNGQFSRVHKSIFSTRADLKIKNNKLENYLVNILEPISSIAMKLGINYEKYFIEKIWRLLLKNSAHDSIGMCNSDKTNSVIEQRYDNAEDMLKNLLEITLRRIGDRIFAKDFSFQVYNTLPYKRESIIEGSIYSPYENFEIIYNGKKIDYEKISVKKLNSILLKSVKEIGVNNEKNSNLKKYKNLYKTKIRFKDEICSMGYKTYNIVETSKIKKEYYKEKLKHKIDVKDDGTITISSNGNFKSIYFENSADEGDSYDYSTFDKDRTITKAIVLNKKIIERKYFTELKLTLLQKIPYNLKKRAKEDFDISQKIYINLKLFEDGSISINTKIKNKAIEHRYRLVVETKLNENTNFSNSQFGTIIRNNTMEEQKIWEKENRQEKPRTIEPMISFCGIGKEEKLAVVTDGVREYQILDNSKIALTLFRSVSYIGKPNLNDRPGRESGIYKKQKGHKLKNKLIEQNYYIFETKENFDAIHKFAKEKLTPMFVYQSGEILDNTNNFVISKEEKNLPKDFSLLEVDSKAVISALKKSEESNSLILRLYNPNINEKEKFSLKYKGNISFLKADEKTEIEENEINPSDIITIKLD
ncbi:MAG: glycosyl hydrolase-related protein [Peptoniphilaceae bacterium]|nr:glycosyl hydrolase-related protein [Peptoniphilaceae bacterium]MDD7383842.1 glycosyl hydrolase-related protein [Peptoniphilaceae bacterium]MDY3737581.1 glycosyl hydrolase-related protein [Peptoniphilaceae bacterium]